VLGCAEGRSSAKWQDYSLHGHQIVCHWVGNDYRCPDFYNPVDGDEVPVPHMGLALTVDQFHALAERVRQAGIPFIIKPHLRFQVGYDILIWTHQLITVAICVPHYYMMFYCRVSL
jgi:uncharacterized protein